MDRQPVFGAKCHELKRAKSDYILLDDLTTKGFKNINRLEGLDQVHTEAALQKLLQRLQWVVLSGPHYDWLL